MKIIKLRGTTYFNQAKCLCGVSISSNNIMNSIHCRECGAFYNKIDLAVKDNGIEVSYEFEKYICIRPTYPEKCTNECPSPSMYCKEHLTDQYFEDARAEIERAEGTMLTSKDKIEKMNESLRQWKIIELSGINNE